MMGPDRADRTRDTTGDMTGEDGRRQDSAGGVKVMCGWRVEYDVRGETWWEGMEWERRVMV